MTRRRPPVRRRNRRPSRRQQQRGAQLLAFAVAAAAGFGLVMMRVHWLLTHWWILIVALALAVLAGVGWLYHRQ
ncbi:hypothetical protein [Streptomyces rubrogriseus]|uniref:hypothetical protein n=1 Tax=Streptomyces rubrogriseus TaxID=194673 RepID=UPI0035686610